ncbi:MAG: DUF1761 domain-containing protein [Bacteroidota bacterium]|nr:DUF1761 domain-containing protein [Bacteroidota bacterium]
MQINFLVIAASALIPTAIGFLWYGPMLFGKSWMAETGMTEEKAKNSNMLIMMGVSLLLSLFLAFGLTFVVIHQHHLWSLLANEPNVQTAGSEANNAIMGFLNKYGSTFRTFKHGFFHGILAGFMFAVPILGLNALYERKSFKYFAINAGYWTLCMALMGGVICAWS